jgi:hypothetical protein
LNRAESIDALGHHEVIWVYRGKFDTKEHLARTRSDGLGNVNVFQSVGARLVTDMKLAPQRLDRAANLKYDHCSAVPFHSEFPRMVSPLLVDICPKLYLYYSS